MSQAVAASRFSDFMEGLRSVFFERLEVQVAGSSEVLQPSSASPSYLYDLSQEIVMLLAQSSQITEGQRAHILALGQYWGPYILSALQSRY